MATQTSQKKYLNQAGLAYFYARLKEIFVRGEEGKGLSSNDFTDELRQQLESLDPEELLSDEDALTCDDIDEMIDAIDQRLSN